MFGMKIIGDPTFPFVRHGSGARSFHLMSPVAASCIRKMIGRPGVRTAASAMHARACGR